MLVKGADWFVDGASGIATKFKIPQLVIGLTIVAMGTSAPEAAVSITAALEGSADITVIFDTIVAIAAGVLLLLCSLKGRMLKRWGGILMLLSYVAYFIAIW